MRTLFFVVLLLAPGTALACGGYANPCGNYETSTSSWGQIEERRYQDDRQLYGDLDWSNRALQDYESSSFRTEPGDDYRPLSIEPRSDLYDDRWLPNWN